MGVLLLAGAGSRLLPSADLRSAEHPFFPRLQTSRSFAVPAVDRKKAGSTLVKPLTEEPHQSEAPFVNPNASPQILQSSDVFVPPVLRPASSLLPLSQLLQADFAHSRSFPEALCNAADTLITHFLTPARHLPPVDPELPRCGGLAPVAETPPTPCSVRGKLPPDLNGVYLRNGPVATHLHPGEKYHFFDGSGMLQSVKIEDGKAIFCARFVKTSRFQQEAEAGRPLFPKFFGGLKGLPGAARIIVMFLRVLLGVLDLTEGVGLSNTSVGFFNGQVLSLSEDGMPSVIRVTESGDLVTVGQFKLPQTPNICAHPKIDPNTGEMFAFSFSPASVPAFSLFSVSALGVKSQAAPVPLLDTPLVHDFAICNRYIVFPDNQLLLRPLDLIRGNSAVTVDHSKTPRFCLMPRIASPEEAASKVQWFEAPGCNCLHYVNAWEEGDEVVVITPVLSPPECVLDVPADNLMCTLSEVRLNTVTGGTRMRTLCAGNFEFGVFNQKYAGRQCRYVYLASGCYPRLTGVVKVDLQAGNRGSKEAVVARREYEKGCAGGEPFFVARKMGERRGQVPEEDDGYLLCHVHNETKGISEMLVMDAHSPSLEIIASVQMPARVPSGFHSWFVSQEQLAIQAEGLQKAIGC